MAYSLTPVVGAPLAPEGFPQGMQFQNDGTDLGARDVLTLDFADNLTATRGVGSTTVRVVADATGAAIQWMDEGIDLGPPDANEVNFTGAGVVATRTGERIIVNIPGAVAGDGAPLYVRKYSDALDPSFNAVYNGAYLVEIDIPQEFLPYAAANALMVIQSYDQQIISSTEVSNDGYVPAFGNLPNDSYPGVRLLDGATRLQFATPGILSRAGIDETPDYPFTLVGLPHGGGGAGSGVTFDGSPVASLVEGNNVTMTLAGDALTIAASGTGGGDVTSVNGQTGEVMIGVNDLANYQGSPSDGQVIAWNASASRWEPQTGTAGSTITCNGNTDIAQLQFGPGFGFSTAGDTFSISRSLKLNSQTGDFGVTRSFDLNHVVVVTSDTLATATMYSAEGQGWEVGDTVGLLQGGTAQVAFDFVSTGLTCISAKLKTAEQGQVIWAVMIDTDIWAVFGNAAA